MRSRPIAPIFTSIVYHHHIPLFKGTSSSPMTISTIYCDWIMTHASEGQAKMRLSACSRCMKPAGVLAGSMEMHTRQIQIKVKTWIRPRRRQIQISWCSSIKACSSVHLWFQCKESTDMANSKSCSGKGLANREVLIPRSNKQPWDQRIRSKSLLCMMLLLKSL